MVDYSFQKAIDLYSRQYDLFPFPVLFSDLAFKVVWINRIARTTSPLFSESNVLTALLLEYDTAAILRDAAEQGGCTIDEIIPFSGMSAYFLPMLDGSTVTGLIVMFYHPDSRPDTSTVHRVSRMARGLETSVRESVGNIFTAMDAAALKADLTDCGWIKSSFNHIGTNVYRVLRMVENISVYSALQSGALPYLPQTIDLGAVLLELLETVTELGNTIGTEIRFDIPDAPCLISVERSLFELALFNLIHNSLYYTREGNRIVIRLEHKASRIVLTVEDRGMGIPENIIPQIWRPYTIYEHGGHGAGIGLGLAIVRAVASEHCFEVSLRSRPGEGTVVTLTCPTASPASPSGLGQRDFPTPMNDRFSRLYVGLSDAVGSPYRRDAIQIIKMLADKP